MARVTSGEEVFVRSKSSRRPPVRPVRPAPPLGRPAPDPGAAPVAEAVRRPEPARTAARPAAAASTGEDRLLLALLPLRFFLGGTFLYAGLDKLLTPAFLREAGPGSIAQQLAAFSHVSPLTPLIQALAQPHPIAIGLLVAVGEIAVGLGVVLGLLYRLSALGGALIALLFFLTASWSTSPYYYGPDLPYGAGFLTLALVGRPGRWALDPWFARAVARADERWDRGRWSRGFAEQMEDRVPVTTGRRDFLKLALLGGGAFVVALGGGLGRVLRSDDSAHTGIAGDGSSPLPSSGVSGPSAAASSGSSGGAVASPAGQVVASLGQLQPRNAVAFQDATTGDPGVVVRLADGSVVGFDAVCTHAGCTVGYDQGSGLLLCPCHGAAFDPSHQAAVVAGPAPVPLTALQVTIDTSSGAVSVIG